MEHLVTAANGLFIASYFVRNLLLLRALSLAGASCLLAYFYTLPEPLMHLVYWNAFYCALNVVWVLRLLYERSRDARAARHSSPVTDAAKPS
ncbi:hypothetical protein H0Z60_03545 [Ectothiorhodospiraceae bacterium WFHF3C12]|nr:hypothetical protein [Ectothiorhodospiraceae bacterium WFHF3C12]